MILRIAGSKAMNGVNRSQFRRHTSTIAGYWSPHSDSKSSRAPAAALTVSALEIDFKALVTVLRSFHEQYLIELRIRWTTQVCTVVCGHTVSMASAKPGQPVTTDDQLVGDPPVFQFGEYPQPEFGAFVAFAEPQPQHVFTAVCVNSHSDIDRPVTDVAIGADFDNDRIERFLPTDR